MKTYKHIAVPSGVDRNLETLRAVMSKNVEGCIFNATSHPLVGTIGCSSISCMHCICTTKHRDLLKEYLNQTKEDNMEKQIKAILKPGMVLRTRAGSFFLWIGGDRGEMYRLSLREVEREFSDVVLDSILTDSFSPGEVSAVFADTAFDAPAVRPSAIIALLKGKDSEFARCVWERPKPVKEMTVDEISKALGYKVKVVGNEQADD